MYQKLRGSFGDDEGMSVLEVVLAAFILFFVLTAVLGLTAATTRMGISAKQHTAITNAISSHIEWMRSIDFDELAITGSTPDGIVDSQTIVTVDGFTITIVTEISDGVGLTRNVKITATGTAPGYSPMTQTWSDVIRDSESGVIMLDAAEAPEVEFIAPSPPDDSVIYGSLVYGTTSSPLYIAVRATAAQDESVIADLKMYCSDTLLRNGTTIFADYATWQPGTYSVDQSFHWNTRQVDDDGVESIEDGWRIIRVLATDQTGVQGMAERRFYVDNYAPGDPGVPVALANSDVQTRVSWTQAMDGTDYAPFYLVRWAQIGSSGDLGVYHEEPLQSSNVFMHETTALSRYTAAVAATNYRGDTTSSFEVEKPYVSRAAVTGTSETSFSGSGNRRAANIKVNLSTDSPTFLVSDISYDVYRITPESLGLSSTPPTLSDPPLQEEVDALAEWKLALLTGLQASSAHATDVGPVFQEEFSERVGNNGIPSRWYYAYKINFTPSGYEGGDPEYVWSDVVGPIMTTTGTGDMVHVTW